MSIKTEWSVTDAKQAYLRWNKTQYKNLLENAENDAFKYIQLIPLFLQLNNRLLPGYVGIDVPVGVSSYNPDKQIINKAKLINNKFRYQQEGVIKNYVIESIIFQTCLIDNKKRCWFFYRSRLKKEQVSLLSEKIKKINQWFSIKNINVEFICLSVDDFNNNKQDALKKTNKAIFMDGFYSEAIVLAGKYPAWWLVPLSEEENYSKFIEHIKQVRFVDSEEYIDLGSVTIFSRNDIIKKAIQLVQSIKQSPELCLINLLVLDQCHSVWPANEGVAWRVKKLLCDNESENKLEINLEKILAKLLRDSLYKYENNKHILSPDRLFSHFKSSPDKFNEKVIDAFLEDVFVQTSSANGIDHIIEYLNFSKAITYEICQIFSNIVEGFNEDEPLSVLATNMLEVLSENTDRVPLYNNKDKLDIVLDKILLRHETISVNKVRWSLVLELSSDNEKTINGFSSLLGLLAWCWLNRVVNHSTQVSIDCPNKIVKQIDAHHILKLLIQQLDLQLLSTIPVEAFENPVRPLQTLLFLNYVENDFERNKTNKNDVLLAAEYQSENILVHCEQLIINSWGDVYTKQYSGESGVLQCLCNWTHSAPLNGLAKPQELLVFGYGEGDSTYIAQRIEEIYRELQLFFYQSKQEAGHFIVKMGDYYYVVFAEDYILNSHVIGKQRDLMQYLEAASSDFKELALERLAFTEYPLREIYQNNKPNVLQVFFQIINRNCHTWVVDENGSLWTDTVSMFERESYITHWLYFFSKISKRLKNISYQNKTLPTLEINQLSINQLGGVEYYTVGAETMSGKKEFLDLQVSIVTTEAGDQLSLACDDKVFSYENYQNNVLTECMQYLSARMIGGAYHSVYVTDIDVPLKLYGVTNRDDIQISHILKFKRNFEHKINKHLNG